MSRVTNVLIALSMAAVLLLVAAPMSAHHGFSAYDMGVPSTVKGTVTDFQFVNPHVQVYFDVKTAEGTVEKWQAELATPAILTRRGWNSKSLKPGDEITMTGGRAKNGSPSMHATKIVFSASGQELKMGGEGN